VVSRNLKKPKNHFIEAKICKLTELVITPNSVPTSTWLCVANHPSWKALHTKRDKVTFIFETCPNTKP